MQVLIPLMKALLLQMQVELIPFEMSHPLEPMAFVPQDTAHDGRPSSWAVTREVQAPRMIETMTVAFILRMYVFL